jgi:hypothetical protein
MNFMLSSVNMPKAKRKKNAAAVELGKRRMKKLGNGDARREFQSNAARKMWEKRRAAQESA